MDSTDKITTYEPNSRQKTGFLKSLFLMAKNVKNSHELIWQLFKRDFLAQYKKSFLGAGWIVLAPIFGIISWVIMNASGVLKPGDVGIPYPAYVLLGTSLWGLFMSFYQSSSETLSSGQGFIMQVKYSHEALLVKQIFQQLVNFCVSFSVTLIILMLFHVAPSWKIVFFPVLILPMLFLGASIGLLVSVVSVVVTEVKKIADIFFGILIFLTPIIYGNSVSGGILGTITKYNPLTYIVGGVRDIIVYGRIEHMDYFLWCALGAFLFFMLSWRLFYVSEEKIIEKMF